MVKRAMFAPPPLPSRLHMNNSLRFAWTRFAWTDNQPPGFFLSLHYGKKKKGVILTRGEGKGRVQRFVQLRSRRSFGLYISVHASSSSDIITRRLIIITGLL